MEIEMALYGIFPHIIYPNSFDLSYELAKLLVMTILWATPLAMSFTIPLTMSFILPGTDYIIVYSMTFATSL